MNNTTISLPDHLERWLRIKAAEAGETVSGWISRLIERTHDQEKSYKIVMTSHFSSAPGKIDWPRERGPDRAGSRDPGESQTE